MQTLAPILTAVLSLVGVLAGVAGTWHVATRKARADAEDAARDDDIERQRLAQEQQRLAQEQLAVMLDSQRRDFEAHLNPIRADVESLRREVRDLHTLIDQLRARYRAALDWAERLWSWAQRQPAADTAPSRPPTLADEVG